MNMSKYQKELRRVGHGLFVLCVLGLSGQVYAQCNFVGATGTITVQFSMPKSLSIPADTPNGTKVLTVNGSGGGRVFKCGYSDFHGIAGGAMPVNDMLPFADSGLGYKLSSLGGFESFYPSSYTTSGNTSVGTPYVLDIYKIGPIKESKITAGTFASYLAGDLAIYNANLASDLNIVAASCEIRSKTVDMGRHLVSGFSGVGSTLVAKDFDIELVGCGAGIKNITYKLEASNGSFDSEKGVAKLDAGSVPGVGMQIKRNGTPVPLARWLSNLPAPVEGNNAYGFSAAYYQTAKKIDTSTVGRANLSLTVTVNYL
jgi:type 1 fimbria pilin